ncbi:MAG: hypothetical protein IT365_05630 [Candidatus Hydrogenedentes bacterium]|nr:hypothetical protein [Candidatus Hydrogenedentota bacterium]
MLSNDILLKHAVIDGYRGELRGRYTIGNVRRFGHFDGISDEKIEALRDYFLECIYPAAAERDRLDGVFERVGQIVRSPRRMAPLMKVVLLSAWKLGLGISTATALGKHVLETHIETRRLEGKMLEFAQLRNYTPEQLARREYVVRMLANTPEHEMTRFRIEVLKLFESLSNVKLLAAAVEIVETSRKLMETRPDLYETGDVAGLRLGHDVLRRGLALFQRLRPSEFAALLSGIEAVEIDWYDGIKAEAAAS